MILVFLGPPGSGKGTQAKLLSLKLRIPHIAMGDILRSEVAKGSEVGLKGEEYLRKGLLVPDSVTIEIAKNRLKEEDCKGGYILDGFPRTLPQAKGLESLGIKVDRVIYISITSSEGVKRLSKRRTCKVCGAVYHLDKNPPRQEGRCDLCSGQLYLRHDDEEEVIKNRFKVYEEKTKPLIDYYRSTGILLQIEGLGEINEIEERIEKALSESREEKK